MWHCAEVSAVVCGSVRACTIYSVRQGVRTCARERCEKQCRSCGSCDGACGRVRQEGAVCGSVQQ